jgi:drug/metabolite transporter (DMT)-like permease
MHAAGNADFWWASLLFRMTSTSVIGAAALVRRPPLRLSGLDLPIVLLVGIGDMAGNLLFAAASAHGLVSVTAVLASLYPVVTVTLARTVLGERVAPSQQIGIALTLAGVALISAG